MVPNYLRELLFENILDLTESGVCNWLICDNAYETTADGIYFRIFYKGGDFKGQGRIGCFMRSDDGHCAFEVWQDERDFRAMEHLLAAIQVNQSGIGLQRKAA